MLRFVFFSFSEPSGRLVVITTSLFCFTGLLIFPLEKAGEPTKRRPARLVLLSCLSKGPQRSGDRTSKKFHKLDYNI